MMKKLYAAFALFCLFSATCSAKDATELARSGKEFVDLSKQKETDATLERVVTVYGMINVRTDGEKVIIAQKLERVVSSTNWDIHRLEWDEEAGEFRYVM